MVKRRKRRAMTSGEASYKKIKGHIVEADFADLIKGTVRKGPQTDKKDVLDRQQNWHSVKSDAKWWQVFLYARSRLETNTIFQGLGDIAGIMVACLDVFPTTFQQYQKDKLSAKMKLQKPMRKLKDEIEKPGNLAAFFSKSIFNGGEVDYLTIQKPDGRFHIFHQSDVVRTLSHRLLVDNSRARQKGQMDCQKVLFKDKIKGRINVGEIEVRTDSEQHYREMKCRFHGHKIFEILTENIAARRDVSDKLTAYGQGIKRFKP